MARPDSLIIAIEVLKRGMKEMISHCKQQLERANAVVNNPEYPSQARQKEKDNCEATIIPTITRGLEIFEDMTWE